MCFSQSLVCPMKPQIVEQEPRDCFLGLSGVYSSLWRNKDSFRLLSKGQWCSYYIKNLLNTLDHSKATETDGRLPVTLALTPFFQKGGNGHVVF